MSNNKNIFFFFVANQSFNGKEMSKSNDCFAINSIFALIFICFDWKPSKCVLDSNDWDWNWNQKGNRILDAFEFKLRISNLFVYSALNIDLIFFFRLGIESIVYIPFHKTSKLFCSNLYLLNEWCQLINKFRLESSLSSWISFTWEYQSLIHSIFYCCYQWVKNKA